jgi:tRNA 2-selenouridine synthase
LKGLEQFAQFFLANLNRIKKRLGGGRYATLKDLFQQALTLLRQGQGVEGFRPAIYTLLVDYYDPMYDYQSRQRQGGVVFEGSISAVVEFLHNQSEQAAVPRKLTTAKVLLK